MLLSYTIAFLLEANSNSCITPSCTSAIPQPKRSHTVAIPYPYRMFWQFSPSFLPVSFRSSFRSSFGLYAKNRAKPEQECNETAT